ncbi:MAG: hypothetical protein H0U52_06880 [Chloroflexi bacterium]|nr:hypothetical protein [Chloroflexota bacterium]
MQPASRFLSLLALLLIIGCSSSCKEGAGTDPASPGLGSRIIDCTKADQSQLVSLGAELAPMFANERPAWDVIEQKAIHAGVTIGGCVLSELVQKYLTSRKATPVPVEETWKGHELLERFRDQHAGGATFHTASGDL